MTFSITARCPSSAMFGIAISSSSPAVAARCAHLRAGVGAVASPASTESNRAGAASRSLERLSGSSRGMTSVTVLDGIPTWTPAGKPRMR